jgi:hypothetical protein
LLSELYHLVGGVIHPNPAMAIKATGRLAHGNVVAHGVAEGPIGTGSVVFAAIRTCLPTGARDIRSVTGLDLGDNATCTLREEDHGSWIRVIGSWDRVPVGGLFVGEVLVTVRVETPLCFILRRVFDENVGVPSVVEVGLEVGASRGWIPIWVSVTHASEAVRRSRGYIL